MDSITNFLPLTDEVRAVKYKMRALVGDGQGNEVFLGLNREQSEWLIHYRQQYPMPIRGRGPSASERARYSDLYEKHNAARTFAP
ncbi:hypothetical protein FHW17_004042 [Phyllobacterium sp. P30BS-XVII]|nr:hypothetical protein [Phyllobacterium sp. P30BS-XVII]